MKHLLNGVLIFLSLILSQIATARDAGTFATKDFKLIEQVARNLYRYVDPEEVLVVFDIDNTLLRLPEDLGSEQWFMWQSDLIRQGMKDLPAVANSVEDLLTVQTWIYNSKPMEIVDPRERTWVQKIRNKGASVIALTSRSLSVRDATLREINRNSVSLSPANTLGLEGEGQIYIPYRLENPQESGLSSDDVAKFKLGTPRSVLFDQGVFFTQGQHKGAMLKTLLARMGRQFKAVIFIDDRPGHIEAMRVMAATVPQDVLSVHFKLSEIWTIPFFESPKTVVQADWCDFAEALDSVLFPDPSAKIYRSCK